MRVGHEGRRLACQKSRGSVFRAEVGDGAVEEGFEQLGRR